MTTTSMQFISGNFSICATTRLILKNKPQKGCTKCQTLTDQHQLVEGTDKEAVEADALQPLCCVQTSLHLGQHRMCTQPMKAEPIPRQLKAQGQECILLDAYELKYIPYSSVQQCCSIIFV